MKYEPSKAEVIRFNAFFMSVSAGMFNLTNCPGYDESTNICSYFTGSGVTCGTYEPHVSCGNFQWNGYACGDYRSVAGGFNGSISYQGGWVGWFDDGKAPGCDIF